MQKFNELCEQIANGMLLNGVLSSPCIKEEGTPIKISMRPLMIKGILHYQLTEQIGQKAIHRNLLPAKCGDLVKKALPGSFNQGVFSCTEMNFHVLVNRKGEMSVVKKIISKQPESLPMLHNRKKKYPLPEGEPIPFLVSLGIMSPTGQVLAKKYDKFKQINRFVEMVNDVVEYLPTEGGRPIEVVDFGCGKSYLTFALYHYLHNILGWNVRIRGLDLKQDVINDCQALAHSLGYDNLQFMVGDIKDYKLQGKVDMVISLHACDTATDAALEKALQWDADVILCVPCCQHELYSQVQCDPLSSLLRHGILRERFSSLVTDAVRAELLTYRGYDVKVLEFIDMEHTPKNLLIRGVKNKKSSAKHSLERYNELKSLLNITPIFEKLVLN